FPTLPASMNRVAEFVLASVLHHVDFLKANLEPQHILWQSTLFREQECLVALKSKVVCCMPKEARGRMESTGIPPHVQQYIQSDELLSSLSKIQQDMVEMNQYMNRFRQQQSDIMLTEEFGTAMVVWNMWFCGNASKRIPPLRLVSASSLNGKNNKKRFSDIKFLVESFEKHAR
ncbi:hypothetical protein GUITHDRAFT_52330, partial [Guillardia theta CCMP2712]